MRNLRSLLLAGAAILVVVTGAQAADQLLSGVISSPSGQKLEGVTVSAKLDGSTITTNVYTDAGGSYYFPPMPAGKYRVWAQALGFETAKGSVDLTAARHHDLVLQPITDPETRIRSCPAKCWRRRYRTRPQTTLASRGSSPTIALPVIRRATYCSSASTKPAGTRSST